MNMMRPHGAVSQTISLRDNASLVCLDCGHRQPLSLVFRCMECNGPTQVEYDDLVASALDGEGMERYAAFLPVVNHRWPQLSSRLVELEDLKGTWAKCDGDLPNGSTKIRQACVAVASFLALKVDTLVAASTGNSSNSYAYWARELNGRLKLDVFVPSTHAHRMRYASEHTTHHVTDVDFVETGRLAQEYAREKGLQSDGGFFNPYRREGLKTAYLEALEQFIQANGRQPDFFVQAVSSGMGIIAAQSAFDLAQKLGWIERTPRVFAVQQDTCSPMVNADREGRSAIAVHDIQRHPEGLATAILRGDPTASYPYVRRAVLQSGGDFVSVTQAELVNSRNALLSQGIKACYAAAATHAAVARLRAASQLDEGDQGVIMITGSVV